MIVVGEIPKGPPSVAGVAEKGQAEDAFGVEPATQVAQQIQQQHAGNQKDAQTPLKRLAQLVARLTLQEGTNLFHALHSKAAADNGMQHRIDVSKGFEARPAGRRLLRAIG
ncbi:hypothetical protein D9599_03765 [Roseomonas sp. KE2513]|nr:hypothetical protein [Roseomonas sp. KE2513]